MITLTSTISDHGMASDLSKALPKVRPLLLSGTRRMVSGGTVILRKHTPIGRGPRKGNLRRNYQTDVHATGDGASGSITNTTPYLRYVLEGRGPVVATRAKALRFVIDGRVFFRKRVKAAKANPFDEKAEPELRANADRIADTITDQVIAVLS